MEVLLKHIAETLDLDPNTVTDFAAMLREEKGKDVSRDWQQLGGENGVVQVDETLIAKAKVSRNRSARPVSEQWVFGAYDPAKKIGWMQLVEDRSAKTLLPIIQEWCAPGTIVVSDGWKAYNDLQNIGYKHQVVIHADCFVDPVTKVHTNNVENYWQRCKRKLKRMYGTSRELLPTYLDEFMWDERNGRSLEERWKTTLRVLSEYC
jgi:transposase